MKTATTMIQNVTGLHARPATEFVVLAKKFKSAITVGPADGSEPPRNAKSVINVLALGLAQGVMAAITAEGEDEQEAVSALVALIESGFGE